MDTDEYTGSDNTGIVATILSQAVATLEDENPSRSLAIVGELERALSVERDKNWKGFIASLLGMFKEVDHDLDAAEYYYRQAVTLADPTVGTFDDTLHMYVHSAYYLGVLLFDKEEWAGAAAAFFHCIPWLDEVFDGLFPGNTLSFLALALVNSGRVHEAIPFARAAVIVREGDEGSVKILRKCEEALSELQTRES